MSAKQPKKETKPQEVVAQQQQQRKLKPALSLKEVIETPDSYLVAKPRTWRVVLTVTNFRGERLKIRITQPVGGRFIQILNVNYERLQDLINILLVLKQKLDELGAKDKFARPPHEELF